MRTDSSVRREDWGICHNAGALRCEQVRLYFMSSDSRLHVLARLLNQRASFLLIFFSTSALRELSRAQKNNLRGSELDAPASISCL